MVTASLLVDSQSGSVRAKPRTRPVSLTTLDWAGGVNETGTLLAAEPLIV